MCRSLVGMRVSPSCPSCLRSDTKNLFLLPPSDPCSQAMLLFISMCVQFRTCSEVTRFTHVTYIGIQVKPQFSFTDKEVAYLTNRIQNGGTEVVEVNSTLTPLFSITRLLCFGTEQVPFYD